MKRTMLVCLGLIAFTLIYAVTEKIKGNGNVVKQDRTLSTFNKISVGGSIDLVIDQNGKESAVVETDENVQSILITQVKDNTLEIKLKEDTDVSATKMIVHVSCAKLEKIASGGSGDVNTTSAIKGDKFSISHGGSGDFDLNISVKELKINTGGSGDYKLKGSADNLTISAAGSGDINAIDLNCTTAKISTAGSGDVKLKKGVKAEVSSAGSGEVVYE